MFWRAGPGGTETAKLAVIREMSKMSEYFSLLRSAGQASTPQWTSGFVPAEFSTTVLKPSQSGSFVGTVQGGRSWAGLGQFGQLSVRLGTASQSESEEQGAQERPKRAVSLVMSKMSMKPSGGSGAIF